MPSNSIPRYALVKLVNTTGANCHYPISDDVYEDANEKGWLNTQISYNMGSGE